MSPEPGEATGEFLTHGLLALLAGGAQTAVLICGLRKERAELVLLSLGWRLFGLSLYLLILLLLLGGMLLGERGFVKGVVQASLPPVGYDKMPLWMLLVSLVITIALNLAICFITRRLARYLKAKLAADRAALRHAPMRLLSPRMTAGEWNRANSAARAQLHSTLGPVL